VTGPQYKRTSAAVLIIATAGLTLPLFYPLLARLYPFGQCTSIVLFGKPCPMCGLTRGFYHIWHLNFTEASALNIISMPLFVFTVAEVIYRAFILTRIESRPSLLGLARPDAWIHAWLAAAYFVYAVLFLLFKWNITL